jgi:hypothetical protein
VSSDGGTTAFKGNDTVLKNNTNANSFSVKRVNQEVKAVQFINALRLR